MRLIEASRKALLVSGQCCITNKKHRHQEYCHIIQSNYAHQSPDSLDGIPILDNDEGTECTDVSRRRCSLALPFGSAYSAGTLRIRVSDA